MPVFMRKVRSFRTVALTLLVIRFLTALNVFSPCHFYHCHTVNAEIKTCIFYNVGKVEKLLTPAARLH